MLKWIVYYNDKNEKVRFNPNKPLLSITKAELKQSSKEVISRMNIFSQKSMQTFGTSKSSI